MIKFDRRKYITYGQLARFGKLVGTHSMTNIWSGRLKFGPIPLGHTIQFWSLRRPGFILFVLENNEQMQIIFGITTSHELPILVDDIPISFLVKSSTFPKQPPKNTNSTPKSELS